jgi:4'-phosphopantetheinyl transferase
MTGLPVLTADASLRWARPEILESSRHRMLRLLSLQERLRYESTPGAAERDRFLLGRVVLRELAAEIADVDPLEVVVEARCGECGLHHGRPRLGGSARLEGLRASLASCDGAVVAAIAEGRQIGVAVERSKIVRAAVAEAGSVVDAVRPLRERAVRKACGGASGELHMRERDGRTEGWIDGVGGYLDLTEPALHPALVVSLAVANDDEVRLPR